MLERHNDYKDVLDKLEAARDRAIQNREPDYVIERWELAISNYVKSVIEKQNKTNE